MKKFRYAFILFLGSVTIALAGSPNEAVLKAFEKKFPGAVAVKWDKENAHEYEASFTWQDSKHSANFNDNGSWLETESEITFDRLPQPVQSAFQALYKGAVVKAAAKIETAEGLIKYEVERKQGIRTVESFFTEDGSEIK